MIIMLLDKRYPGQWHEELPQMAWWVVDRDITTSLTVIDDPNRGAALRITSAIAKEVPESDLAYRLAMNFNSELNYGRIYFVLNEERSVLTVLMQEIVPLSVFAWDSRSSIKYVVDLFDTMVLQSGVVAAGMRSHLGGEPWGDGLGLSVLG